MINDSSETILEVRDVKVTFSLAGKQIRAVTGASFELAQGKVLAILGESGCGKSVLGSAILKILPDNAIFEGEVNFAGVEIMHLRERAFRKFRGKGISVAMQGGELALNPLMRVGRQVQEAAVYHGVCTKKDAPALVKEYLISLGLNAAEVINCFPYQLSGGMNQRVLLAMTAILEPELLLVDEPTKGLDYQSGLETTAALKKLCQSCNSSILLITHDLDLVKALAGDLIVMYAGEIIERGKTALVFNNPRHPYTRGLIASAPQNGLVPIRGAMPDPGNIKPGCRFAPRCDYAQPICKEKKPELIMENECEGVRCFYATGSEEPVQAVSETLRKRLDKRGGKGKLRTGTR